MNELHHFVRVDFHRFKAFERFALHLRHFNILVGPNNSGKSTILAAFRVLAAAMRKARSKSFELVPTPQGQSYGYNINLSGVSVAEENIFFNYNDDAPASVRFKLSNNNELLLSFPELGSCYLTTDTECAPPRTPSTFRKHFNCPIGFVPILGPVDHSERLYKEEAARLALFNYTAARNFRNIWYHYPDQFDEFCDLVRIHARKEVENFLLVPRAIDRAADRRVAERVRRGGRDLTYTPCARTVLDRFAEDRKNYLTSQYLAFRRRFQRRSCPGADEATANEIALKEFDLRWNEQDMRFSMVPGKDALSSLNEYFQETYGVTVTPTAIVDSMRRDEVPEGIGDLMGSLNSFADVRPGAPKG